MIEITETGLAIIITLAGLTGASLGLVLGIHYRRPVVVNSEIKVDAECFGFINQQLVQGWLDQRGLVWMPKGTEFKAKIK